MMKVQLRQLQEIIDADSKRRTGKVVPFTRTHSITQQPLVIDGPFTESKESCAHVAIIARCIVQARR
jgi:hypothetical protein